MTAGPATPAGGPASPEDQFAGLTFREAQPADAAAIAGAIDTWWPARHIVHGVCPQLLEHMGDTCLLVEKDGILLAFLVGYMSQRLPNAGYIHYAGVRPAYRGRGLGREMYRRFAELTRAHGRYCLVAETGLWNTASLAFHIRLGFTLEPGDIVVDGVPGRRDVIGVGCDYATMILRLDEAAL